MTESLFYYDAEVAVLSIILKQPELIYNLPNLKPDMFSSSPYVALYSTMLELTENKYLPDYSLVKNKLEADGKLQLVGGEQTLQFLVRQENKPDNLKEFERQIISSYKAKLLLSSLAQARNEATNVGTIDDTIISLKNFLDNLDDTTGGDSTQVLSAILEPAYFEIINRINNPSATGIKFGIKDIDALNGSIAGGEMWVIAGRPSMGKTAIICNSALNTAKMGTPILIFSQEMNKQSLVERLLAVDTGVSVSSIHLGLKQEELNLLAEHVKELKSLPIYLDCTFGMSLNYMLSTIRKYHKHNGIKLVYLDYIQLLSERDENQTAELGRISRSLKLLAGELNIGIVVLSQLNRLVELREEKRPVLSDLRQSGNLEEDADLAAFLYRDEYYNEKSKDKGVVEFIVRKNRSGPIGTIPLKIDLPTNRISDY